MAAHFRPTGATLTADEARSTTINRATLRRAWRFAQPYHRAIGALIATIAASSLVAIAPPLVFKRLIDTAIPRGDGGMVTTLVAVAVGLALAETALRLANRFFASRIGEGLI